MRYFELTLTPDDGALHPADRVIAESMDVSRIALMHIDALGDGTGVLLYRLAGEAEPLVSDIEAHESVIAYDLLDVTDDYFHLYLHVHPGDPAGTLMSLAQKYALMIDTPVEFVHRGAIRLTLIGAHEMLRQAIEEVPNSITVSIEQVGNYSPDRSDMLSVLTERQVEVFRTAVDLGYYEIPRRATHEDIAGQLGCAPSTVDEHLRKAESRVLSALVG